MKRVLLLLLAASVACSSPSPYVTTVGVLRPGRTMAVEIESGTLNAYQPAVGQPRDLFTVSATAASGATPPPAPRLRRAPLGIVVRAGGKLDSLLVRVPDGVNLVVQSQRGDVNVTDISGNARVLARDGNVNLKVPGYAQAAVGHGNLSVMMGATLWPGTLRFSTQHGDVEVWIESRVAFGAHLHAENGAIFTDFGLRGISKGAAETIDGSVNGGTAQRVDIETLDGAIRLLRLQPQP
ncbi:MAG: hypothetical protein JO113_08465 [Candidatus Eremiobacteraeota bacterium]|nr:hypothetical protein [Candidatus Eremiobacteraeota bacterium]